MKNLIQSGDVVAVTAPTGGVSSGDGIVIGNLFGMCATDADQTEKVELSLTGVLGQWPDRRGREGLGEHHGCPRSSLPDGTAVKAAGTSDTTVRVRFDGVPVVAAGPQSEVMGHGKATFKQADLTRALRAVEKAGRDVVRAEIARDGRIVLVFKNGEEMLVERNEWDEWRASN
jgi:hypothetical protein